MIKLVVSHPPMALSPNGRAHWAVRGREAKKVTTDTLAWLAHLAPDRAMKPNRYRITWFYCKGGTPDGDNCTARCKYVLDGVAKYFGVNDSSFVHEGTRVVKDATKAGTVEVELWKEDRPADCPVWRGRND